MQFDDITKLLISHGFKHWMPGARLTGKLVYYRRPRWWKFWQGKEFVFLGGGEWAYAGPGKVHRFGRYEDMAIELFGGMRLSGGSEDLQRLLLARSRFIEAYCKEKGWTEPLSMQQVMEIRAQEGWKHPDVDSE
jgi:hypothetical protein